LLSNRTPLKAELTASSENVISIVGEEQERMAAALRGTLFRAGFPDVNSVEIYLTIKM